MKIPTHGRIDERILESGMEFYEGHSTCEARYKISIQYDGMFSRVNEHPWL